MKVYFEPLAEALHAIAVDELGREAIRHAIQKIAIRNSGQFCDASGFRFESGTLHIDHRPEVNVEYVSDRVDGLRRLLESSL